MRPSAMRNAPNRKTRQSKHSGNTHRMDATLPPSNRAAVTCTVKNTASASGLLLFHTATQLSESEATSTQLSPVPSPPEKLFLCHIAPAGLNHPGPVPDRGQKRLRPGPELLTGGGSA